MEQLAFKRTKYMKRYKTLDRRRVFLTSREDRNSYDEAELLALNWVLGIIDEIDDIEEELDVNLLSQESFDGLREYYAED